MAKIYPIIMCGGSGTRMWPLSRNARPKQYHALVTNKSMLHETVERALNVQGLDIADPSFISAAHHQDIIEEQCAAAGIEPLALILEPMARNTAPVAAIAAKLIADIDPSGHILLLPADHHIEDKDGFWHCVAKGVPAANDGYLTTLGIGPTGPETGYGYICAGEKMGDDLYHVDKFVEKPNLETAKTYLASGNYSWNAGIFLFAAQTMLDAFKTHAPDILEDASKALRLASKSGNAHTLDRDSFAACRAEPVDITIMEKSDKVAMVSPVNVGWSDIGSWTALSEMANDESNDQSAHVGDIIAIDCKNSYIRSDSLMVGAIGLENMVVVVSDGAVLIAPAGRAQEVKDIVAKLKTDKRGDVL